MLILLLFASEVIIAMHIDCFDFNDLKTSDNSISNNFFPTFQRFLAGMNIQNLVDDDVE